MEKNIEATSTFGHSKCSKRICLLPDEILVSILSCLTIKEAARTSVLSSRWRFLWTYFKGKMDFVLKDWQLERAQFVTTMNEILKLHRGTGVERLRIIFDEVHYSGEEFHYWIEFAAKKEVQRLQFMLGSYKSSFYMKACDTKPRFLTCFSFKSLQVLVLRFIEVNDEDLEFFLTNCPKLELLDLQYSKCLSNIFIPSSSLSLKEFSVVNCENLRKIEISARNLEVFDCIGPNVSIEVKEVLHKLHTIHYGFCFGASLFEGITKLRRSLPLFQLEKLRLDILNVENYLPFDMDHFTLPKLKLLVLVIEPLMGDEMLNCIHLLEAAPILHTFTVHFYWFDQLKQGSQAFDRHRMRRHECLKVVNMVHFVGLPEVDLQFVKILIDNVESLEKMIVIPIHDSKLQQMLHRMGILADCNVDQLFENGFLPAGTELVIEGLEYIEKLL